MNELMEKYSGKGLVILGFPCNQFGHQENTSDDEILNSLKYVRPGKGFVPKIELFCKVSVNGDSAHPLFVYLKNKLPLPYDKDPSKADLLTKSREILWNPVRRSDVAWNFEKFLIDSEGVPFQRYSRYFLTSDIAPDIEKLLSKK